MPVSAPRRLTVTHACVLQPQPDPKGGGPDHIRACYAAMAHAYGLNYHHVEPSDAVFSYDIGCMTVPPAGVVAALRRLGVAKP